MVSLPGDQADRTPTARTTGAALTADRLGAAWPEVSGRLRKMLASRGVDPSLSDDIVQEVAVRALDKRVPFTDPADLYRWAATTARRLHIDHIRSDGRTTYDDALLTVADGTDVEHTAERRVALDHVLRAMAGLRPGERDAILDSLEESGARTSQALVRRHRARATLRKAVGGAIAALVVARVRLQSFAPALRNASAASLLVPAIAVGSGALLPEAREHAPRPHAAAPLVTGHPDAAASRPAARRPTAASVSKPVIARLPAAAPVRPARTERRPDRPAAPAAKQVGPVFVQEDAEPPPDDSAFCLESEQRPVWCLPPVRDTPSDPAP